MRILLDECIDESLRYQFTNHECQTCRFAGFKGLANGKLLAAAEKAGFDVLITVDQNLPHQQNVTTRVLSIVILRSRSTSIDDLVGLMPAILAALRAIEPGQVLRIGL
jgi:predicted nuclease of predicted toxin-antitoxin system